MHAKIRRLSVAVLATALASAAAPSRAEAPRVIASILPVQSLVAGVMDGVGTPALLVRGGASPHTYALRPSEAKALQDADVVFWIGEEIETFLEKPLEALPRNARVVALHDVRGITLLPTREGGAWDAHDDHHDEHHADEHHGHEDDHDDDHRRQDDDHHGHEDDHHGHEDDHHGHEDDHHGHEGTGEDDHGHGAHDMHLWLNPANARAMVGAIATALSETDPSNAERYRANATALEDRLADLDAALARELAPVKGRAYVVFHDAYQYFERRYGLTPAGSITVDPDRKPSAARLAEIREKIADTGSACVFAEPQFEPAVIATVIEGTNARTGVLDPLGADLAPGPDAYATLLRALAASLRACLKPSG